MGGNFSRVGGRVGHTVEGQLVFCDVFDQALLANGDFCAFVAEGDFTDQSDQLPQPPFRWTLQTGLRHI